MSDLLPGDTTQEERREIAQLVREFAGRLEREAKPAAKKRAARFHEIARQIHDFGAVE
jgi:hypothetical protein